MPDWKNWFSERKTHCRNVVIILAATGLILYAGSANGWQLMPGSGQRGDIVDVQALKPVEETEPLQAPEETLLPMQTENGQWGYVDMDGEMALFPQYDEAGPFTEEGLALVTYGGKTGYIDKTGKWVIGPKTKDEYFDLESVTELAVNPAAMEEAGVKAQELLTFMFCGRAGAVDAQGKVVVPFRYSYLSDFIEAGGRKVAIATEKKDEYGEEYYGLIDTEGNVLAPFEYDDIYGFADNDRAILKRNDSYGIIDAGGNIIATPEYDYLTGLTQDNYVLAEKDGCYGVLDLQGRVSVPFSYRDGDLALQDEEDAAQPGIYLLRDEEDIAVFFCSDGRLQTLDCTDYDSYATRNNFIVAGENERYGVFNNLGEPLTAVEFDEIYPPDEMGDALVMRGGKWGVIDRTGKTVVKCIYDDVSAYDTSGMSCAEKDGKWGCLNRQGEETVPFKYEELASIAQLAEYSDTPVPEDIAKSGYIFAYGGDVLSLFDGFGELSGSMEAGEDEEYEDSAIISLLIGVYGPDTAYGYTREELEEIFIGDSEADNNGSISYMLDEESGCYIVYDNDNSTYGLCDGERSTLAEAEYYSLNASAVPGVFYTGRYDEQKEEYYEGLISVVDGKAYTVPADYETVVVLENGLAECRRGGTSLYVNKYGEWVMRAYDPQDGE